MLSDQDCEHPAEHPGSDPQPSSEREQPLDYARGSLEEYEQWFRERHKRSLRRMYPDWTEDQIEERIEVNMKDPSIKGLLQDWMIIDVLLGNTGPDWGPGGEATSQETALGSE